MRKINFILLAFAFVVLSSCSKTDTNTGNGSNNNGGGGTAPAYFFTCKVNGTLTDFTAMTLVIDDTLNPKMMFLIGQKSNTQLPSLTFTLNYKAPGWIDGLSYILDEHDLTNFVEYKSPTLLLFKSTATPASATTGLTIKFDKILFGKGNYASGTFSGTLQLEENTTAVAITEGKFKVQFLN